MIKLIETSLIKYIVRNKISPLEKKMINVLGIIKQIQRRIGFKTWNKLCYEVKYILIGEEFKSIRQETIRKYGSQSNYIRHWLKMKGLKKIDYVDFLAQQKGYKNQKEYLDERYRAKGFKDKSDRDRFYRLRKKHHKSISDFDVRKIQLKKEKDRDVKKELQEFILIRKGMRKKMKCKGAIKSAGKPSNIHPTIGVYDTQNCRTMNLDSNPSKGENLMSPALTGSKMAGGNLTQGAIAL